MAFRSFVILAACGICTAFQLGGAPSRLQQRTAAAVPQMSAKQQPAVASSVIAASLAMVLASSNPIFTPASQIPLVEQSSSTMLAAADDDLTDAQRKFMEERKKLKTQYEAEESVNGNFKSAEEVKDKKSVYTLIVGGLVAVAFIAPMLQYFYYTMGE